MATTSAHSYNKRKNNRQQPRAQRLPRRGVNAVSMHNCLGFRSLYSVLDMTCDSLLIFCYVNVITNRPRTNDNNIYSNKVTYTPESIHI